MKVIYLVIVLSFIILGCTQSQENVQNTTIKDEIITKMRHHKLKKNKTEIAITNTNATDSNVTLRMMSTPCTTPNDDAGYCLHIKDCKKLLNQLDNKNAIDFLLKSRCGPKNENPKNPKVCCGKYHNYIHLVKEDLFPKSCGQHHPVKMASRVFGGRESRLGEFPWMARLMHKNSQKVKTFGCAGFLIAAKFVLTAAHCLKSDIVDSLGPIFEVQLGEHDIKTKIDCSKRETEKCAPKPQVIRVRKNIVHPEYNSQSHHHDIGLIHLKKPAVFTDFVSPICVVDKIDFKLYEYWISGWGRTETETVSAVKMKLNLKPFPLSNCTDKYSQIGVQLNEKQICAGGIKNKDSCTGDSGGPLMHLKSPKQYFAAGVVSYGYGCGKEGWPGVYTNVTSYMVWIRRTMLERIGATTIKSKKMSGPH